MMFLLIVTLTSMLLAAIMSVIAWRIAGDERRRSEARVAALSAQIHDAFPAPVAIVTASPRLKPAPLASHRWHEELELRPTGAAAVGSNLLAAQRAGLGSPRFGALAAGALVFGAIMLAVVYGGRFNRAAGAANPVAAAAPAALPLELVALGHERVGDQLTIRGVVRNPASGTGLDRVTAVVFLFTPDGGFIASGRAAVESAPLQPGGESTFVVTVPRASDVGRYRVSFRTDDHLVSHVDRRHES
jgi:hypothetical protein